MLASAFFEVPVLASLGFIALVLALSVIFSLRKTAEKPADPTGS